MKEELEDEKFINMAIEWVSGGCHYSFGKIEWNGKEEFSIENNDKTQKFMIMKYSEAVIIHLVNKDGKIIWTNDFVLTTKEGRRVLAVQLYSDAEDISAKLPVEFNRPRLLKTLISKKYGDIDNNLMTDELPLIIDEEKLEFAKNILLGTREYLMPIVYITSTFASSHLIDYNELAKDLAGVAHVVVEKNNKISREMKVMTNGKNPYNGAIQIIYSNGVTQRILPEIYDNKHKFRKEVSYAVFRKLILGRIEDDFSWTKIRYNNLMKKSKESMEIAEVCDDIIAEKDTIIDVNNQRIQELEEKNMILQNKLIAYEHKFKKSNKEYSQMISLNIQEEDLYEDEIKDVIVKVLQKELNSMDLDPNLKESRKYHVLLSLLQQNSLSNRDTEIITLLKDILNKDGSFNKSKKRQLYELDFEVEEGKHYKITFHHDSRYMFTVSKTSSDYRANLNAVTKASNKLFGC
ncbi:MAG: hypothetical protein ACLRZ9_11200 [Eubacterium sp.]